MKRNIGNDPQGWKEWAGQKIRLRQNEEETSSSERITLFPGWATRRYDTVAGNGMLKIP
jgi:hypothetical protein